MVKICYFLTLLELITQQTKVYFNNNLYFIYSLKNSNTISKLQIKMGQVFADQDRNFEPMKVVGKNHKNKYNLDYIIGQGCAGLVYSSRPYAVKEINTTNLTQKDVTSINREIEILSKINHANVIRLVQYFQQENYLYLVMELCDLNLSQYLFRNTCSQRKAIKFFDQILEGYKYLIKKGIIHRDIKPQNILLNLKGQTIKITDFGFARFVDSDYDKGLLKTYLGSPGYISPQIIMKQQYTTKSDIWSLGSILYLMIYKRTPWYGSTPQQMRDNLATQPLNLQGAKVSQSTKELIKKMLVLNETQRIGWNQLFQQFDKLKIQLQLHKKKRGMESCF